MSSILIISQVDIPEEGEAKGGRLRSFMVKIKWAASVDLRQIDSYLRSDHMPYDLRPEPCEPGL